MKCGYGIVQSDVDYLSIDPFVSRRQCSLTHEIPLTIMIRHLIYQTICVLHAEVRERVPSSRKSGGGELDHFHILLSKWNSSQFFVIVRPSRVTARRKRRFIPCSTGRQKNKDSLVGKRSISVRIVTEEDKTNGGRSQELLNKSIVRH